MIQKDYVLQMARYNAWQNNQLRRLIQPMGEAELRADRGAFFGSIFATLNHILWADTLWMSRFCSDVQAPAKGVDFREFAATPGEWDAMRFRLDGRMRIWAQTLSNMDLRGDLEWYSGTLERTVTQPVGLCITHMFNHQTHHRGQIHQMLGAMGAETPVSDLVFMPEDA
ncbi:DinB family protein [Sulfitobacter albidus]|uniref:DinB family protein n=1 Tax=Sulfitobacter albidus TaxID=2829501 RepID=A0A975JFR5_9RHOB|nr:DinB family protein [Sulfitobacter albidus]QUJ77701.1 DinB family protein [Sulfitobacter albidus]